MTTSDKPTKQFLTPGTYAALGASLPLAYLAFIILTKEEQFESWMYSPLMIIPAAGALAGLILSQVGFPLLQKLIPSPIALLICSLLYLAGLWISAVGAFAITGDWN